MSNRKELLQQNNEGLQRRLGGGAASGLTDGGQIRVIALANQPRMLRELVGQVLAAARGDQIVIELDEHILADEDSIRLLRILDRIRADWLILPLPKLEQPSLWLEQALGDNPTLSVLGISEDGDQVQVRHGAARGGTANPGAVGHAMPADATLADLLALLGIGECAMQRQSPAAVAETA